MLVRLTVLMETLHVTHVTHDLFGVCKQHIIYRVHLFISIQRARKYRLRTLGVHKNSLNLNLHALQLTTSPIWQSFRQNCTMHLHYYSCQPKQKRPYSSEIRSLKP